MINYIITYNIECFIRKKILSKLEKCNCLIYLFIGIKFKYKLLNVVKSLFHCQLIVHTTLLKTDNYT